MIFEPSTDPVYWSVKNIVSLGHDVIDELAKRSSATVNSYQLVVGRCLLAVERSKLHEARGYSGAIHYAIRVLGLGKKKACELRRVARQLEALPRLSKAAELGQVSWGKLRAIVSKATLETEDFWLGLADLKTCSEVESLVAATEQGKMPWDSSESTAPTTRFQLTLGAEAGELFERVVQTVSQDVGKPMSPAEVLEHLAIEKLARRPLKPAVVEAARKEARRGCAAAKRRHSLLVKEARELAHECGLIESRGGDPLAVALGSGSLLGTQDELRLSPDLDGGAPIEIFEVGHDQDDKDEMRGSEEPAADMVESIGIVDEANGDDTVEASADGADEVSANVADEASANVVGQLDQQAVGGPGWDGRDAVGEGEQGRKGEQGRNGERGGDAPQLGSELVPVGVDQPDWNAIIDRAIKEKKFVLELEGQNDWKNKHVKFNPEARFVTPAQRRELLRRDGYCCSNPGCPNHLWLEIHHVMAVSRRGKTMSFNLVALCSRCHRNVHKGLLKISGDADRGLIFRDAEGNDLERAHASRVANWLNLFLGWDGGRNDFHRPTLAAA